MRDAGKRGPEAGGGAKGSEEEVVGFVHIFFWGGGNCDYRYSEKTKVWENLFNWIVNGEFGWERVNGFPTRSLFFRLLWVRLAFWVNETLAVLRYMNMPGGLRGKRKNVFKLFDDGGLQTDRPTARITDCGSSLSGRIIPLPRRDVLSRMTDRIARTDKLPTLPHLACHHSSPLATWTAINPFTASRTQRGFPSSNMPAPSRRSYSKWLASTWSRIQI